MAGSKRSSKKVAIKRLEVSKDSLRIRSHPHITGPLITGTPIITNSSPLPNATVGQAYQAQLTAAQGTPPYKFGGTITPNAGNWASISQSGLISGTPTQAEVDTVSATVTDANLKTGSKNLGLTVQSAGSNQYKFNPGQGMLSDNRNGSPNPYGSGGNAGEINVLANCVTNGVITGTTVPAYYQATYTWNNLEYSQGVYTGIQGIVQDFLYLQQKCPGCHFMPSFIWFAFVNNTNINAPVNGAAVPDYILNAPGTYGAGPNGQGGYGWSQWSGTNGILCAAMWNANVKNRILALVQAIANTAIPDGLGHTFDTHPLIEGIQDVTELSLDFVTGGVNPTYSPTAFYTQYNSYISTAPTYLPHTQFIPYIASYGLSSDPGDVPNLADLSAAITNAANTTGTGISNADTGITFGPSGDPKTSGQHLFAGDTTSNTGSSWNVGAGTDLRNQAGYCAVFQSPDYSNIGSGGYPARLQTLYNGATALKSRYMLWDIQDETNPSLGYGFFTQYVLPFMQANPNVTTTRPNNLP